MKRFKHVLTTTDLSPESFEAVGHAAELAARDDAKLTICYVPPTMEMTYSHITPTDEMLAMEAEIRGAAESQLGSWIDDNLGDTTTVSVLFGDGVPHEEISRIASAEKADVIVMATHGLKGIAHTLLGSVTERVIRNAPCPVLAVPPSEKGAK